MICPEHPECDKESGAVHACAHNAQCAALVGIAAALKEPNIADGLCGKIKLCAVPAEEMIEMDFRMQLKEQGIIQFFGGKQEFIARGYFDDVDLAFIVHTSAGNDNFVNSDYVGNLEKQVIYKGVAAHAGGHPWAGKNALYAANCGLNAVNALRETFKESDYIRFHPIITKGGAMVNAIPATVVLESKVRGASFQAIVRENKKIDRALIGSALSLGVNIEIIDVPGYAPLHCDEELMRTFQEATDTLFPERKFSIRRVVDSGSTDLGDLSTLMPVVRPYAGGAVGNIHGSNFYIADPIKACVNSAKMQLAAAYLLLKDGAERAKSIIENYRPEFTVPEYLAFMKKLNQRGERIEYADGKASISL